jgi:hypothetical protein
MVRISIAKRKGRREEEEIGIVTGNRVNLIACVSI